MLLFWAFCKSSGHTKHVISEFPFGSKYRCDFCVIYCDSGCFEIHFIELEPVDDLIIGKSGKPLKRFNGAYNQIQDWDEYCKSETNSLRREIARYAKEYDLINGPREHEPSNYAGEKLSHPDTFVKYIFHIVIGRRKNVTPIIRNRMNKYRYGIVTDICTYDRFLDIADNFDKADMRQRVCMTDTKDEY
jgi:hypothetical protein